MATEHSNMVITILHFSVTVRTKLKISSLIRTDEQFS